MPTIVTRCCDCGLGCVAAHEWYRVRDTVWELAWRGRRKPWQILGRGRWFYALAASNGG
jgi:hypothetical protein